MTLFKRYQPFIIEALGAQREVLLDEMTGQVTLIDAQVGERVTLTALQTLVLAGFLKEHETIIFTAGYAALAQRED